VHLAAIDTLLRRQDSQEVADALVDIVEAYGENIEDLEYLVNRYHDRIHSSLLRVLTFYIARNTAYERGSCSDLIYRLAGC